MTPTADYTREFVFNTPQRREFLVQRVAHIELPGGMQTTTLDQVEVGMAGSVRLVHAIHDANVRRMHVRFHLGRYRGETWVGTVKDDGVVFNGLGYVRAGLHENEPTEERLLYTLAEFFDWNGVVADRSGS